MHGPFHEPNIFIVGTALLHNSLGAVVPAASVSSGWKRERRDSDAFFFLEPCHLFGRWFILQIDMRKNTREKLLG